MDKENMVNILSGLSASKKKLDMVVHACNPSTWEVETEVQKSSLGYTMSWRLG
jgi:hypothetical protein